MSDDVTEGVGTNSDAPPGQAQESKAAWYIDDNTPGEGERPEWLPTQFVRASDLGKSYAEAQKKLGAFTGAPETYDLKAIDVEESFLVQEMMAVGKELNMSQEGLAKFIGRMATASETMDEGYLEDQVKSLGKEAEAELLQYKNFVS